MNRMTPLLAAAAFLFAGCSGAESTTIEQGGSSTVFPIAEAWSESFGPEIGASIVLTGGGTGSGINQFCRGELDIADASRPIKAEETASCEAAGITPFEIQVGIDGIAVVVGKDNTFADCLTVEQLHSLWTTNATARAHSWQDLNPAWPDTTIRLYGPGTDSGTYDYWKEAVIHPVDGKEATTHHDFTASESDEVLVRGVSETDNALGFFGLAYYDPAELNLVKVDGGNGCVEPTHDHVAEGIYAPLSRPLFMYTDGKPEGALHSYFELALSDEGQEMVSSVGYIELPAAKRAEMAAKIA